MRPVRSKIIYFNLAQAIPFDLTNNWQEFKEKLLKKLREDLEKIEKQFYGGKNGSGSISEK